MLRSILLALLAITALAACSSMSEEECQIANWEARGVTDGTNGLSIGAFERFERACSRFMIQPNYEAYQQGRLQGLQQFCTPEGVYAAGLRGVGQPAECGSRADLFRIHRITSRYAETRGLLLSARREYESVLRDARYDRDTVRDMRRRLRRDDLSEKERNRAEDRLDDALRDLDDFPFRSAQLQTEIFSLERQLDSDQAALVALEIELGMSQSQFY